MLPCPSPAKALLGWAEVQGDTGRRLLPRFSRRRDPTPGLGRGWHHLAQGSDSKQEVVPAVALNGVDGTLYCGHQVCRWKACLTQLLPRFPVGVTKGGPWGLAQSPATAPKLQHTGHTPAPLCTLGQMGGRRSLVSAAVAVYPIPLFFFLCTYRLLYPRALKCKRYSGKLLSPLFSQRTAIACPDRPLPSLPGPTGPAHTRVTPPRT